MRVVADKAVLAGVCVAIVVIACEADGHAVAWLLVAVTVSALCGALEEGDGGEDGGDGARRTRARAGASALMPSALLLAGALEPRAVVVVPLLVYDLVRALTRRSHGGDRPAWWTWALAAAVPVWLRALDHPDVVKGATVAFVGAVALLGALLAVRTVELAGRTRHMHVLRDDLDRRIRDLVVSRARLEEASEYEARAAVLGERTRIAQDIHDGVGHQLTRLLLQARALEVVHRDDEAVVAALGTLTSGIDDALTLMRTSVHDLADDAQDLATTLHVLAGRSGLEVDVECDLEREPPAQVARCVSALVREALTNAVRHGRAQRVSVSVTDLPALWRVRVVDDGAGRLDPGLPAPGRLDDGGPRGRGRQDPAAPRPSHRGLGLMSMADRVEALGGRLHVHARPRFTILATIPKPQEEPA
ncbi:MULTISPECIES: sensor histidine kinase [Actinomyces]|uniref:histidine kinase n=1 Tax=Actinomyces respiraculi TaxID=2744574 RepID=A0A7T0LJE2_9ACTO|nr:MULTISPECIES: histidine kinase [Actinomyces]QPL04876.1 ATP-binding protein [Actinomyces respiraculi]